MEEDQKLQKINDNIFNKIYIFFKRVFYNKRKKVIVENLEQNKKETKEENDFRKNIKIDDSKNRMIYLKQKFDNRLIDVKEISMKDKMELLELYKQEVLENKNRKNDENFQKRNKNC